VKSHTSILIIILFQALHEKNTFLYEKSCHGAPDVALTTTLRQHVGARGTTISQCLATTHFSTVNHLRLSDRTKKVLRRVVR